MPTLEEIAQAGQNVKNVSKSAANVAAGEYTVGDRLKRLVTDAFDSNQDIVKPLDVATQEYLQGPQVAREKYQDIFNPFSREKLVSQYTGNLSLPMLSLSSILGQRFGRVDDLIGSGTRAYQAESARRQGDVGSVQQELDNLLTLYGLEEEKRRWDTEQASAGGDMNSFFEALLNKEGGTTADDFVPDEEATTDTFNAGEALKAIVETLLGGGGGFESGQTSGTAGGGGGGGGGGSYGNRFTKFINSLFGKREGGSW